ncbi:hypothetical protein PMAYCL1PPCAC_09383, partial [Pristionchus mayeri]
NNRLNVFFQGFWAGVHVFKKSLGNVRSIYLSNHVDHDNAEMALKLPNSNLAPPTFNAFQNFLFGEKKDHIYLVEFSSFPIGTDISMAAVLRA